MERVNPVDPQSAADYDDRTTAAVKSVLIEVGQILGAFKGKFAVVGGVVPWLLLNNQDMPHVGTLDVDLGLDAEALGDGEYAILVEALMSHGYQQSIALRRFQLVRRVQSADGDSIDVVIDFLMPRDAVVAKNIPPLINEFAVQRADGADLALRFYQMVAISGSMPAGGTNRVEVAVCSIPGPRISGSRTRMARLMRCCEQSALEDRVDDGRSYRLTQAGHRSSWRSCGVQPWWSESARDGGEVWWSSRAEGWPE